MITPCQRSIMCILVLAALHTGKKFQHGKHPGKGPANCQDPAHPEDNPSPQGCQSRGVRTNQQLFEEHLSIAANILSISQHSL